MFRLSNFEICTKPLRKCFMRLLFHYYTQILYYFIFVAPPPLVSRQVGVFAKIILKFARNHWGNVFYEVAFPLLHTNFVLFHICAPLPPLISRQVGVFAKLFSKFARNHWGNGFYDVAFLLLHTISIKKKTTNCIIICYSVHMLLFKGGVHCSRFIQGTWGPLKSKTQYNIGK